jgi:hypothetical protein
VVSAQPGEGRGQGAGISETDVALRMLPVHCLYQHVVSGWADGAGCPALVLLQPALVLLQPAAEPGKIKRRVQQQGAAAGCSSRVQQQGAAAGCSSRVQQVARYSNATHTTMHTMLLRILHSADIAEGADSAEGEAKAWG